MSEKTDKAALAGARGSASTRETRMWWTEVGGDVKRVKGYSCAPSNPDVWWCPEVGYSLSEKHHLFNTEREAIEHTISELESDIKAAQDNIAALKRRLPNQKVSHERE